MFSNISHTHTFTRILAMAITSQSSSLNLSLLFQTTHSLTLSIYFFLLAGLSWWQDKDQTGTSTFNNTGGCTDFHRSLCFGMPHHLSSPSVLFSLTSVWLSSLLAQPFCLPLRICLLCRTHTLSLSLFQAHLSLFFLLAANISRPFFKKNTPFWCLPRHADIILHLKAVKHK